MKKVIFFFLLIMVCLAGLQAEQDKPIITVLDFKTDGISQSEMSSIIGLLSSSLFKTDLFTVIDVSQRETVLNELEFSMSGCTDDSCMLEVGKMLSAEGIVVGSIGRVGSKYVLSTKLLETETARTLSTADGVYPDLDTLLDGVDAVAAELAGPYGAVAVKDEPASEEPSVEPAAVPESDGAPAGEFNLPAVASLAAGIGAAGAGAYFLVISLPLVLDYLAAKDAYDSETDEAAVTEKYTAYNTAWQAAVDGNAETNLIIGASLAGAGVALGILSAILFSAPADSDSTAPQVALIPAPGAVTLSFSLAGPWRAF